MTKSLLEIGSMLPPLLERQISPPYRIVERHLDYLQKWRKSDNENHPDIMSSINLKVSKLYGISELSATGQLCQ